MQHNKMTTREESQRTASPDNKATMQAHAEPRPRRREDHLPEDERARPLELTPEESQDLHRLSRPKLVVERLRHRGSLPAPIGDQTDVRAQQRVEHGARLRRPALVEGAKLGIASATLGFR